MKVARRLEPLLSELVVVGGCAAALHMPPSVAIRPTDDVDCVSLINTYAEFAEFEVKLRRLGCVECRDEGAPLCRWLVDGVPADFVPTEDSVLGFSNRWYSEVVKAPVLVELASGLQIQVVNIPLFLATKFDAFAGRGEGVHFGNSDIEDIISLVGYRSETVNLIAGCPDNVRNYLRDETRGMLALREIENIVSGFFDGDTKSQAMVPIVLEALRQIAR